MFFLQTPYNPQPNVYATQNAQDNTVMTTGDWFVTQLILAIPLVNIIMLLVWGFSSSGNLNRRNFCRATLIWAAIALGLYVLFFLVIIAGSR
ncbi:MAG: hypothetical protein R3C14_01605 [Caldilineaceae bacterium]